MKKILPERFGIIQKVILVLAVLAMSVVWPMGAFPVSHLSTSMWDGMRFSGPSNESGYVRQEFSPNFDNLESISVYVVNDPDSIDTMKAVLRVYDYTGVCLSENYFQVEDYELPGYINVPVGLELSPGTLYFYTIGGVDGDLFVAYCNDEAKTAENGAFFYKEIPSGGTSIVTEYQYERPMGLKRILMCDALCLFAAMFLIIFVVYAKKIVFDKCADKAEVLWRKAENIVRYSVVGVAGIGVVVAFVGIVLKRFFTDDVINIIVLFAGVLIAAAYICYIVLTCKSELEPLAEGEDTIATKTTDFVRTLLFAAVILMCCMYQNGYSNYEKGLYLRKLLVFFGLFMVSLGKRKWIWNIPNAVWSIVTVFVGKYHIANHSDHIEHIKTATNEAWVIWVIGLLLIQIIYRIIKGEWKRIKDINWIILGLTLVFWVCCIIFANGRQWPAVLCVTFLVWIFVYVTSDNKQKILEIICNGILLAFVGTVMFCLYRRPYQYYMLTRYGGIFFTATATAIYYVVPAAAALTKILVAIKENCRRNLILSSAMFGIVVAYLGFTASRTGIVAFAVMGLFAFLIPCLGKKREILKKQFKGFGIVVISVIMTFVMSFSATRMIPAIVGNPFYFWYEEPNAFISGDTPWNGGEKLGEKYIDIQKCMVMLFGRLFTMEEKTANESADMGYVLGPMLVSTEEMAVEVISDDSVTKYSNGRIEIYKSYIEQLNINGHDTMSATDSHGELIMHAHNSYLQVAYDFGIPVGILFLILCLVIFICSLKKLHYRVKGVDYSCLLLLVVVGFGVASVFEWAYHISNPLGFLFLLMLAPIIMREKSAINIGENS